jgi:hypothetical protein
VVTRSERLAGKALVLKLVYNASLRRTVTKSGSNSFHNCVLPKKRKTNRPQAKPWKAPPVAGFLLLIFRHFKP